MFIVGMAISSQAAAQERTLDAYIQQAFQSNDGLRQQQFQLDKSLYALDEAKSLFLPNVSLQSSYTKASGGRAIDVPLGDMLNGVYTTLNTLTGTHRFPQLQNETITFNPDNYYDAHLHTTLPLVDAELWYNKRIKQQQITGQQAAVNVYKRELVRNVKTAYFQYYQAVRAVSIYNAALDLVAENIRVNQSMLANGVRNSTALTRSLSEQQRTLAQRNQAANTARNAKAYFNFLLNRPSADTILLDTSLFVLPGMLDTTGIDHREELEQWKVAEQTNALNLQLQRSYIIPQLSTFLDLGSQGVGTFDNQSRYYFWGVSLQWNLFAGGQHTYRARQAEADRRTAEAGYDQTAETLHLELTQSFNNYHSALETYQSTGAQLRFAQKYLNDQNKAYREGQLLYVELLDAQNQLTEASLEEDQAFAGVQIALADLERTQATYPLKSP
ncbi:TolC family protein [Dinghuibacter silviterrae]|uniref:TolC family protein n=1 Tax=Dinghuibacter silviterrae TaxID=1539049 RepID=UPI0013C327BA|nr:TolC family protein [Dinghuibacter silviterrae]